MRLVMPSPFGTLNTVSILLPLLLAFNLSFFFILPSIPTLHVTIILTYTTTARTNMLPLLATGIPLIPFLLRECHLRTRRLPTHRSEHDIRISRRFVENQQFLFREDARNNTPPQRNKTDDNNRKADRSNRLRNRHTRQHAESLEGDVIRYPPLLQFQAWLGWVNETPLRHEVHDIGHDPVPTYASPADDEEDAGEEAAGHSVQHRQQRACHCADQGESHQHVGDALFLDADGFDDFLVVLPFFGIRLVVAFLCLLQHVTVVGARIRVDGCLRDQAIGQWDADYAAYETGAAQKEEVPVEAGRFGEGKLLSLCGERADIMIVVEEQRKQNPNGQRDEHPFHRQRPEVYKPGSISSRIESARLWYTRQIGDGDAAGDMRESGPKDCGQ